MQNGDFDGARADVDGAAAILRALDPDHPRLASVLLDLALVSEHRGRIDEGIALRREVLASSLRRLGSESAEVRYQRVLLGAVLRAAERYPEAEIELREAIRQEANSPTSVVSHAVSSALFDLSTVLLKTGRPREALVFSRQSLERVLALGEGAPRYEIEVARLQLAQALVAVGDPTSLVEARRLAQEAAGAETAAEDPAFGSGEGRSPHDVFPTFVLARIDLAEGHLSKARMRTRGVSGDLETEWPRSQPCSRRSPGASRRDAAAARRTRARRRDIAVGL